MKVVKLMGGLGNQMFQYAFGKALEYRTGLKVLFDNGFFEEHKKEMVGTSGLDHNGVAIREYEIDIFNVDIQFATKDQIKKSQKSNKNIFSLFFRKKKDFIFEEPFNHYNENLFRHKGDSYYIGYFQSEKYFEGIEDRLRSEFSFPEVKDEYNAKLVDLINNSENPVAIHVRRGDYLNFGVEHLCTLSYYKEAAKIIDKQIKNPTFFVFCAEDTKYIENTFDIGYDFQLIGIKNNTRETYYENMRLMSLCDHIILANSSYSWWAAWLNKNPAKIVIAPDPWGEDGNTDHICENWIKVKRN